MTKDILAAEQQHLASLLEAIQRCETVGISECNGCCRPCRIWLGRGIIIFFDFGLTRQDAFADIAL